VIEPDGPPAIPGKCRDEKKPAVWLSRMAP
jgi:hypothetical protein